MKRTIVNCDRCKCEINSSVNTQIRVLNDGKMVAEIIGAPPERIILESPLRLDFCDKCANDFANFMKGQDR